MHCGAADRPPSAPQAVARAAGRPQPPRALTGHQHIFHRARSCLGTAGGSPPQSANGQLPLKPAQRRCCCLGRCSGASRSRWTARWASSGDDGAAAAPHGRAPPGQCGWCPSRLNCVRAPPCMCGPRPAGLPAGATGHWLPSTTAWAAAAGAHSLARCGAWHARMVSGRQRPRGPLRVACRCAAQRHSPRPVQCMHSRRAAASDRLPLLRPRLPATAASAPRRWPSMVA